MAQYFYKLTTFYWMGAKNKVATHFLWKNRRRKDSIKIHLSLSLDTGSGSSVFLVDVIKATLKAKGYVIKLIFQTFCPSLPSFICSY